MGNIEAVRKVKEMVEAELLTRPGVTGVDIGYKVTNGERTDILSIRIYVASKRDEVSEDEMIPPQIDGVPTDVIERKFDLH